MTEHTVTTGMGAVPIPPSIPTSFPGIEHGWVAIPRRRARAFRLWKWHPREILNRGGRAGRDEDRAYSDLQAIRDRSEW